MLLHLYQWTASLHIGCAINSGLVVDPSRGLVVVDRNTVPIAIGDVLITVANSVEVTRAKVVYLHPLHDFVILAYDPETLGKTEMQGARLSETSMEVVRLH